jgi:hypothetical protein
MRKNATLQKPHGIPDFNLADSLIATDSASNLFLPSGGTNQAGETGTLTNNRAFSTLSQKLRHPNRTGTSPMRN